MVTVSLRGAAKDQRSNAGVEQNTQSHRTHHFHERARDVCVSLCDVKIKPNWFFRFSFSE